MCAGEHITPLHYYKKMYKEMDKKMYFAPEFEIVDIQTPALMAGSITDPDADGNPVKVITDPDDKDFDW